MGESNHEVEKRIQQAVEAVRSSVVPNRNAIAREFNVPVQRLRSRLKGCLTKSATRASQNKALTEDQELALHRYLTRLDELGMPARLNQVISSANTLLRQSFHPTPLYPTAPTVSRWWAKRWLDSQPNLHKVKRKPLAVARKESHTPELMNNHFNAYRSIVEEKDIQPEDTWNFDETGFRLGIVRNDWVISKDPVRKLFSKDPDNRESLTDVESINGVGDDIPPMLILQGVNHLEPYFINDLDDDVLMATSETGYSNDFLAMEWIRHFDKFSARVQKGEWRLLIMDGHGSHHTREFIEYCDNAKIIPFGLPAHSTHLLQPLDVVVFQPLKHWHAEAVSEAMQSGDETFSRVEFLAAFSSFRRKAFKPSTIRSAWKKTGLIPFDPSVVLAKIREIDPPRATTTTESSKDKTRLPTYVPQTAEEIHLMGCRLLVDLPIGDDQMRLAHFIKGSIAAARVGELAEARLDQTVAAENARKARKKLSNRVLQNGGVLYAKNARAMTRDRLELEEKREAERVTRANKLYDNSIKKMAKTAMALRRKSDAMRKAHKKRHAAVMKELLKKKGRFALNKMIPVNRLLFRP